MGRPLGWASFARRGEEWRMPFVLVERGGDEGEEARRLVVQISSLARVH